jgi:hypothetical protein
MSTRSRIGYADPKTGLIHSIYCHWDGYLSNNGRILRDHYKDMKKVKRLIALGSLSSLEANVSWRTVPKPFVNRYWREGDATIRPQFVEKHTFDTPVKDVTVAYHRDRGEAWDTVKPEVDSIMMDLQEYNYLFKKGHWYYKCYKMNWTPIPEGDY